MAYSDNTDNGIIVPKKWYEKLPREAWNSYEKIDQPDDWFEVYKLTETVYAIYEPGQFEEVISYLVLGEKKAALIDTGNGIGDIKKIVERLTDLPIMVVNTHTHADHIGKNSDFEEIAVYDTEYSRNRAEEGQSKEQVKNFLAGDHVWMPLPTYFEPENYLIKPFKVTRWLQNRDIIDLGGRSLEVLHTPGHAPDAICILDRKNRLFWTGDTFYPAPIYVYKPTTSLDQFIDSFAQMVELMPLYDWVMPSHNEPRMEKHLIKECYESSKAIRNGTVGEYVEGVAAGINIHRFNYERFSLIVRAEKP